MGKIIIEIIGGLGNQMFQYALYIKMRELYGSDNVSIYLGRFDTVDDNKGYQIERVFSACDANVYTSEVFSLIDENLNFSSRLRRRLIGRKKTQILEVNGTCDADIFNLKLDHNYYIRGLWQSEQYFLDFKDYVREAFTFLDSSLSNKWANYTVAGNKYISLHVRRGDYVDNPKYSNMLGNVCDKEYYIRALEYCSNEFGKDFTLIVFSDDIAWVKSEFDFLNKYKVMFSNNSSDIEDLFFMSMCDNNIIANSTFSWWGAWLNSNEEKVVIAPKKWSHVKSLGNRIVPNYWITI